MRDLRREMEALKQGQKSIQRDLDAIKKLLQGRRGRAPQPFKPVLISIAGDPIKGNKDAKVTLLDFSDYQ